MTTKRTKSREEKRYKVTRSREGKKRRRLEEEEES
jgi:hypothetical protein